MSDGKSPSDYRTMAELRAGIDALDETLVTLLTNRAGLIDRAIQLKTENGWPARIPERVEEVVSNVRTKADAQGIDPDLIETIWRQLIEWSIEREENALSHRETAAE